MLIETNPESHHIADKRQLLELLQLFAHGFEREGEYAELPRLSAGLRPAHG
ncbi:MAG: hypothetical protein OEN22_03955 [Gammaproteobacteria bacterium]|nr:hypothetical protein [Gammaproteobacteria bacterium]